MDTTNQRRARDKNERNPTIIAYASVFQGTLKSSTPIIVSGIVEGNCQIENVLNITKSGKWLGNIHAQAVIIDGTVKGDIVADDKVEIGPTGQIIGNIIAGSLAIASGAVIEGDMKVTEHEVPLVFEEKRSVA